MKPARLFAVALIFLAGTAVQSAPVRGPLHVSEKNPRYFTDGSGRAVLLTGSHVWNNIVDMGPTDPPPKFDFGACLDWMGERNHNFIRLWTWELVKWDTSGNSPANRTKIQEHYVTPHPWQRTGPGDALDGKPKFDLTKFNPEYFDRLRTRIGAAEKRGVYVSVMLFEGWGLQRIKDSYKMHPFHPDNNINGIKGDRNGDGVGVEIHELGAPEVLAIQKAYVRKVIDTVNGFDNLLYEISNENHPESTKFQYFMIDFIHEVEKSMPKQHPVGMTFQFSGGSNKTLFDSPAEWISPNHEGGYRDNPPAADGSKVILTDTDHLWGIGGSRAWAWKSCCRGMNPLFMDPYDGEVLGDPNKPGFESLRRNLGYIREYSERLNLIEMTPRNGLSSTRFCLANPGEEYLVYCPSGDSKSVTVKLPSRSFVCEWFNPASGKKTDGGAVKGSGGDLELEAPFEGDAVLYLKAQN